MTQALTLTRWRLATLLSVLMLFAALGCAQETAQAVGASETVTVNVPDDLASEPFDTERQLVVPPGFAIDVWARVENARFMAVAPNGDVLVSQPNAGGITLLRPGEGASPESFDFASGLNSPHDLVFHELDGQTYLYIAEANQVTRYPYEEGMTSLPEGEVIVQNLPNEPLEGETNYRHPLKNIAVAGDTLYVSIASSTYAGPADLEAEPKRGAIYTYSASTPNQEATSGRLYAEGVRNAEGLTLAPDTGDLWVVVNNRDQTLYPFHDDWENDGSGDDYGKEIQSFVDNYPAEEIIHTQEGAHYGWPFCNPNPANGYDDMPFDVDVETNAEGAAFDCEADATPITKGVQAHAAPLGASFWLGGPDGYENALVVALHGSWNRSVLAGNKVVFFPYQDGALSDEMDLVTGWVTNPETQERWGRPVDVLPLADGSLLISDDFSGTVYHLYQQP